VTNHQKMELAYDVTLFFITHTNL